jgi:hypothetical protein
MHSQRKRKCLKLLLRCLRHTSQILTRYTHLQKSLP